MIDHAKTINESTMISLLNELDTLAKAAKNVREKLLQVLPFKYGSNLWWEKETVKSLEEYRCGKFKSFNSAEELIKDLNS